MGPLCMGFGKFCNLLSYLFNWVFRGIALVPIWPLYWPPWPWICVFLMMFYGFDPMGFITMVHHHLGEYVWMFYFSNHGTSKFKMNWWILILFFKRLMDQAICMCVARNAFHREFFFGEFATLPKSKSFTGKKCLILLMVQKSQLTTWDVSQTL